MEVKTRKGTVIFDRDEHPRADTSMESLSKLKPVFKKDGTVTAGNASGLNDAGSCLIMMSAEKAKELGLTPITDEEVEAATYARGSDDMPKRNPGEDIKAALLQGGSPATPEDLRKRFETFLNDRCKGKDTTKLRFVVE